MMRRRSLLLGAGSALAGTKLPLWCGAPSAAEARSDSFELRLAEFALAWHRDSLSAEMVEAAKCALLDTLGCALGAVGSDAAEIAGKTIRATFGEGDAASIIGQQRPATVEGATFVNGILVRSLDLNDTYLGTEPLHPSEIVPAALALCEAGGHSGRELIEALVIGYEASSRINDAVSFMERGFHPMCAAAYSVPLMAGRLWGLKREAIAHAVGLSAARGYTSFVINSGAISMMKAMGLAGLATDGIFATRLAANGFTGPQDTLEWVVGKINPGKSGLPVDLAPERPRLPRVSFKRFPIQIELAAPAEAGILLSGRINGRFADIREITVETYPGIIERVADAPKFDPKTKGTADHSLPVCLAMALLDGDVTVAQFDKDRWRDRDVMELVRLTKVRPSETLMAKLPKGRGATVALVFSDGSTLRETVEVPEGDPMRPLSRASLERKFFTFADPVLGREGARRVLGLVDKVDDVESVRSLMKALTA
ncbi:MmgE/PrpD family protein (plasmid) [Methylobacterium phyllosphaerae]